jgi:lysozyme
MYVIQKNDTLSGIGKKLQLDWLELAKLNNLKPPYVIFPGHELKLPGVKKMQISQSGINLIKKFEGCRLTAYHLGSEKYYTIGWGHYGADVRAGQKITQAQADALFLKDIQKYVDGVNNGLKVQVNQSQFDAMVSLCYNIGIGGFQSSTVCKLVNQHDFKGAGNAFTQYTKSGGKVLPGLVSRRNAEKDFFFLIAH